jgi:hypothetical protein
MRPALAALHEQQKLIAQQSTTITALRRVATTQRTALHEQAGMIQRLAAGLQAMAEHLGPDAVSHVAAAMVKRADVQNPAQPVPEPPSEPSPHGTQETKTPEAFADVTAPGLVPGSTQDVAADVTSTVYTPGQDIPAPPVKQLVDVTRPVDGTQSPQPLGDVKTLTDVRVGDPMNPQTAFPLRGPFANGQRTSSVQGGSDTANTSNRTMAALRLAKLRIEAGTAESADEFAETGRIEANASMTVDAITAEINTLAGVKTAAQRHLANRNPSLVPRQAAGTPRSVPSLQSTASTSAPVNGSGTSVDASLNDSVFLD